LNDVTSQITEDEISLKELLAVLKKRYKVLLITPLIFVILSALITFFVIQPEYKSHTTLLVGNYIRGTAVEPDSNITYQEIQTNRLLVPTYREIARSRTVLGEVIDNLDLDTTYGGLRDRIDVQLVNNTEIISITVTDRDPVQAAKIANEITHVFSEHVENRMRVENIQIIDAAIPSTTPVKPRPILNIAIAGVLGVMVGVFIAFVLEFFDTTIKTPEDIQKYTGLPVISSIPYIEE
jgi:capsular polysaccharide biosynthesis protein